MYGIADMYLEERKRHFYVNLIFLLISFDLVEAQHRTQSAQPYVIR